MPACTLQTQAQEEASKRERRQREEEEEALRRRRLSEETERSEEQRRRAEAEVAARVAEVTRAAELARAEAYAQAVAEGRAAEALRIAELQAAQATAVAAAAAAAKAEAEAAKAARALEEGSQRAAAEREAEARHRAEREEALIRKEEAWERERRQSAERLTELEAQIESERRAERQRASDLERRAEHERREAEAAAVLSTALAQQGLAERTLREAEQRRADEDAAAFAAQLLREAAEEERLERLGTRAAMSFRNQKLNSGFVTWKDMARVRRHQRRRAAGVLHSLRDLRVRRALNSWLEMACKCSPRRHPSPLSHRCGARSTRGSRWHASAHHGAILPPFPTGAARAQLVARDGMLSQGIEARRRGRPLRHAPPSRPACVQLVDRNVRSSEDGAAAYALGHQRAARQLLARRLVPMEPAHPLKPSPSRSLRAPTPPRSDCV